ncbi:MAG TPA: TonB-dependent receptor [Steroidobacteraceae bacterium]|nr:TonB-dependent receptor [Steroidobacteraceae bacterium]
MKKFFYLRLMIVLVLALRADPPLAAAPGAQGNPTQEADDAFGRRIGVESFGLYSESQVRGFNLQEAGNYRMNGAYFVRAAGPADVILRSLQIKVGPSALDLDFPAPSGLVAYELLSGDKQRREIEFGLQHLQDSNPRPYVRAFITERFADGAASISGGWIGANTARYIYGNEAEYHGVGVIPRIVLADRWQLTAFASRYEQSYEADVGFIPAAGVTLPELDRLQYLGQRWSQFDTTNENHGLIVSTLPRDEAWDFSLSSTLSRIVRPRSDFNIFRNVQADGLADASVVLARDRRVSSWAHELSARRDWIDDTHRTELTVLGRYRDSNYRDPLTSTYTIGRVSLLDEPPRHAQPIAPTMAGRSTSALEQYELGVGVRRLWRGGLAANLGVRHVSVDETSQSMDGVVAGRTSSSALYNASVAAPIRGPLTMFVATTRGIEEAGAAPANAANRYEVLAPILARQSEVGVYRRSQGGITAIATAFEIEKPEPGFDADNEYRYLTTVQHRGVEASIAAPIGEHSRVVLGAMLMRARLSGELVASGAVPDRPVGRSARVASISFERQLPSVPGLSLDIDAAYTSARLANTIDGAETPGYVLTNVGARYRFSVADAATTLRLRIYNATNEFPWYASSSGFQSYEPERRVMLSVAVSL